MFWDREENCDCWEVVETVKCVKMISKEYVCKYMANRKSPKNIWTQNVQG